MEGYSAIAGQALAGARLATSGLIQVAARAAKNLARRGGRAVEGTGLENLCPLFSDTFSSHTSSKILRFYRPNTIPDPVTVDQSGHYVGINSSNLDPTKILLVPS